MIPLIERQPTAFSPWSDIHQRITAEMTGVSVGILKRFPLAATGIAEFAPSPFAFPFQDVGLRRFGHREVKSDDVAGLNAGKDEMTTEPSRPVLGFIDPAA